MGEGLLLLTHLKSLSSWHSLTRQDHVVVQRWTKRRALGWEKFLPGPAWLLLSETGPPFSPSLYNFRPLLPTVTPPDVLLLRSDDATTEPSRIA